MADIEHTVSVRLQRDRVRLDYFNGHDNADWLVACALLQHGAGPQGSDEIMAMFVTDAASFHLSAAMVPVEDCRTVLVVDLWGLLSGPDGNASITLSDMRSAQHSICGRASDALRHMLRVELGAFWTVELVDDDVSHRHRTAINRWTGCCDAATEDVLRSREDSRRESVLGFDFLQLLQLIFSIGM